LPEQDAVVAITSGVKDMQSVLNLVWEELLPAMKPGPLATDQEAHMQLAQKLSRLTLRPQEGKDTSAMASQVSGKEYVFAANLRKLESIAIEKSGDGEGVTLLVRSDGAQRKITCRAGKWNDGRFAFGAIPERPVAASGGWTAEDTFMAKICFYETPFCVTMTLKFSGGQLLCDTASNVAFGPTEQPRLVGTEQPVKVD
jgi:hypothetical protein